MVTSDYPNMTASGNLLAETANVEANHAHLGEKLAELHRQYEDEERQAYADFQKASHTIDVDFEQQKADIVAQLGCPLSGAVERVLQQKRDLEMEALRRRDEEKAKARRSRYEVEKQKHMNEVYVFITSLITTPQASPGKPPIFSPTPMAEPFVKAPPSVASPVPSFRGQSAPPVAVVHEPPTPRDQSAPAAAIVHESPSQSMEDTSPLPAQSFAETGMQSPPNHENSSANAQPRSPQRTGLGIRDMLADPNQPSRVDDGETVERLFREQSSAKPPEFLASRTLDQATPRSTSAASVGGDEQLLAAAPRSSETELVHKRKANGESIGESPVSSPNRNKRAKHDKINDGVTVTAKQSPPVGLTTNFPRTISFNDVFGTPGNPPEHRHIIVQYPPGSRRFYILRCDEHGVHFGEHPLRGAAKHLASAQHDFMSKAHTTAIETLGHLVVDCTQEMADQNNKKFLDGFRDGTVKVFNANNLSMARRAQLGFGPLTPPGSQKAAAPRKQSGTITNPVTCKFYLGSFGELKCPVLILPWGDTRPAGIQGTLAETGLFGERADEGKQGNMPQPPKCYAYDERDGRIRGIVGWARGYENGGPLEKKREFPVLCAEDNDCRNWPIGWVKAVHLSPLDFDDPGARNVPFIGAARDYIIRVLRQRPSRGSSAAEVSGTGTRETYTPGRSGHDRTDAGARNVASEDIEMRDAGPVSHGHDDYPGRGYRENKPIPLLPKPAAMTTAPIPPAASARSIAAQALDLQTPPRSAFRAINASSGAETIHPHGPTASLDPPSRAGSVSSGGGGHKRVIKIHAHSRNPHPGGQHPASPPVVLPERPADGTQSQRSGSFPSRDPERTRSPASLQNILQEFPSPAPDSSRVVPTQSSNPPVARRPLPSAPMRVTSPSRLPSLTLAHAKQPHMARDSRAGSAPAQQLQTRDSLDGETQRAGSASAVPGTSRAATPQLSPPLTGVIPSSSPRPPASEVRVAEPAEERRHRPPALQLPPLVATWPLITQRSTTPLATPTTSAGNTRANSPTSLPHLNNNSNSNSNSNSNKPDDVPAATSFSKPATPTLTPLSQPGGGGPATAAAFVPTMDVFDLSGFMEGATEVFRAAAPGQYLRLLDNHQTGVLATPADSPVAVRIDPREISTVERAPALGGAACVVTLTYRRRSVNGNGGGGDGDGEEEGVRPRTQTLVLEMTRSAAGGMQNGMVHARRLCRRLGYWNPDVVCPAPAAALSDSVPWRFAASSEVSPAVGGGGGGGGVKEGQATAA